MKRLVIALFAAILGSGLFVHQAEAARLGSGKSFGMSRSITPAPRPASPSSATPPPSQSPAPAPAGRSPIWGMLGGLALGAGLGALLSSVGLGGMGGGLLMTLLLVGGVILLFRLLANRYSVPQPAPAAAIAPQPLEHNVNVGAISAGDTSGAPMGFDVDGFVREAKLNFIRLQAANDAGNMDDLKLFTTPEVFAEIQMQYQERGRTRQQTDVVQLGAVLLGFDTDAQREVASVRYSGLVREQVDGTPVAFDEIWHLVRPTDRSSGWMVAGIQQAA